MRLSSTSLTRRKVSVSSGSLRSRSRGKADRRCLPPASQDEQDDPRTGRRSTCLEEAAPHTRMDCRRSHSTRVSWAARRLRRCIRRSQSLYTRPDCAGHGVSSRTLTLDHADVRRTSFRNLLGPHLVLQRRERIMMASSTVSQALSSSLDTSSLTDWCRRLKSVCLARIHLRPTPSDPSHQCWIRWCVSHACFSTPS